MPVKLDVDRVFLRLSIIFGEDIPASSEVFNNYGAKPNSELILGYGFALPNNPDDTIVMQLGGSQAKREIGRKEAAATGEEIEALLEEATQRLLNMQDAEVSENDQELANDKLYARRDAAAMLIQAVNAKFKAQPKLRSDRVQPMVDAGSVRRIVVDMIVEYVHGKRVRLWNDRDTHTTHAM